MSDAKRERARIVYDTICAALDERDWKYEKDDDELLVHFTVTGDDLPMQFLIFADIDRQLVRLLSPMPFDMSEDKRIEGTIAICHANYGLTDGSFDYDLSDGRISYRMTHSFMDNDISTEIILYMIDFTGAVVDKYNDKFFALNKGFLDIEKFLEV